MSSRAAGFSPLTRAGFELFFRPWMWRRIHAVRIAGLPRSLPPDLPLLLVSNHVSWWDGFVLREVQRALRPRAPLHWMMLERELARTPLLRRLGALGIDPARPATVARALREIERRVRARPDSTIFYFPQGAIWPSFRRPLGFRRGVELLVRRLAPLAILPVGLHLEPLKASSPTVFALAGEPILGAPEEAGAERLEAAVAALLDRLLAVLAEHGEEIDAVWPRPLSRAGEGAG